MADDQPNPFQQHVIDARAQGFTWDEINAHVSSAYDAAKAKGFSDAEIASYMGYKPPSLTTTTAMANQARSTYNANPPLVPTTASPLDAFQAGVHASSGGLIASSILGKRPEAWALQAHTGLATRLAYESGNMIGDIPAMIGGFIGGAAAGAGATVETGPGAAGGAVLGAGAGTFGLPAYIKANYADMLHNGEVKGPADYVARQGAVWAATAKQAAVGELTMQTGGAVGGMLKAAGVSAIPRAAIQGSAELGTMTAAGAAMEGRLPTKEELIDNALLMATVHGIVHLPAASKAIPFQASGDNLTEHWIQTGDRPGEVTAAAANDPPTRQAFATPRETPRWQPPGSTTVTHGDVSYTIPRLPGNFEAAVSWLIKEEGGYTVDTGGPTKYGISKNANPDVDIPNLTKGQAAQIYYDRYWKPLNIDSLPDSMKLRVFDAAASEGVGKAREFLRQAGNDPAAFDELRREHYRSLAEMDPGKYGKYLNNWLGRLTRINGGVSLSDGRDLAVELSRGETVNPPALDNWTSNDPGRETPGFLSRFMANESGAVGGPPKEEPPAFDSDDHWGAVAGRIADAEKPPSMGEAIRDGAHKVYLEMMNPDEPLGKLVKAATEGGSLDDAKNPLFLQRLAESSDSTAKYMLERGMLDTEGNVVGPGLKQIMEPHEGENGPRNFWTYAVARWAADAAEQKKQTGVEMGAALKVIQDGHKDYGDTFKALMDWRNGTLAYARDGGVVSAAAHDTLVARNTASIPGYRVQENLPGREEPRPASGNTPFDPIKEMLGSTKLIKNIQESLMKDAFLRVSLANHNLVNQAAADAAIPLGLAREEGGPGVSIPLNAEDLDGKLDPDMDVTVAKLAGQALKEDEVPVLRDGQMSKVVFADPDLAPLLKGMNNFQRSTWSKVVGAVAKFQRTSIVLNPAFPIHLLQYDIPFQFITKPGFRNTIADAISGIGNVFTKSETWDEWMRKGAPDRILDGLSKNEYMKNVLKGQGDPTFMDSVFNVVNSPVRALRAFSMAMSQVMPVGRYARTAQLEPLERAFQASEAPFHRSGAMGPAAKQINTGLPFFTAYLNGLEKSTRALVGLARPGEPEINAFHTWAKAAAVITVPIIMQELNNRDKEWYKAVPDYVKDNALLIHIGPDWERTTDPTTGQDTLLAHGVTIPWKYPPILTTIFGAIPRRLVSQFVEDNPHAWKNFGESGAAGFAPPGAAMPSILLPFVEHAANWSFFGHHALVSDAAARSLNTPDQYTNYTTGTAKMLSRFISDVPLLRDLKFSPPVVDNYIRDWAGTLGDAATHAVDDGLQTAGLSRQRQPTPHWEDTPLASSFIERYPSLSAQQVKDFDSQWDDYQRVHGELAQAFKEDNFEKFQQILAASPTTGGSHSFAPKEVAGPANIEQYAQAFQTAQSQVPQATMDWLRAAKAVQNAEKYMKYIDSLPTTRSNANDPRAVTQIEKRQLYDMAAGTTITMAERANALATEAGIK